MAYNLLRSAIEEWKKKLTLEEKEALNLYTTSEYSRKINATLRNNGINNEIKADVNLIDSALKKFFLPWEVEIFRSEGRELTKEKVIDGYSIVNRIIYKNYISTSISKDSALSHLELLKEESYFNSFVFIQGILPKATNCGCLDEDLSEIPEEKEILVFRNMIFEFNSIYKKENIVFLDGKFI